MSALEIADVVLPVFAVIVTGWGAGALGLVSRALADGLIHFAYNFAMPALLFVTVAEEPARALLEWRFVAAFGGGSLICFALVFALARRRFGPGLARPTMYGIAAAMTNTGFVALPILAAVYGQRAVLPAAIATLFVAVVMFPAAVIALEIDGRGARSEAMRPGVLARHIALNPMVFSTLLGVAWSILGVRLPGPLAAYLNIFAGALTPCALFAIGLGLSVGGLRATLGPSVALTAIKLVVMPLIVYGLALVGGLDPLATVAAVICAAVPTAKTVYILAGEYACEETMVASTVSMTTLFSVLSLLVWLYALSGLSARISAGP